MNGKQLPVEVKRMIATRVASGDWTLEQAAEATTYSVSSVRRWTDRFGPNGDDPGEVGLVAEPTPAVPGDGETEPGVPELAVSPELVAQMDAVMEKHPHFGRQALREWMLRHHRVAVPARVAARYLAESGRGRPRPSREAEQPPRWGAGAGPRWC